MTVANVPTLGTPGAVVTTATLNTAFTQFASTVDTDNLRVDAIQARHLVQPNIQSQFYSAKNTDAATANYTGLLWQAITHGTTALLLPATILADGNTLRIHWHQYLESINHSTPIPLDYCSFRIQWDIGAGWVSPPDSMEYIVCPLVQIVSGDQPCDTKHNMMGSYTYQNSTGSTINVLGVRLEVRPSWVGVGAESCDLGEGVIYSFVHAR